MNFTPHGVIKVKTIQQNIRRTKVHLKELMEKLTGKDD